MSYILDALKKIEFEKSQKNRASGRVNISGDLFHERRETKTKSVILKMTAMVIAVSLAASAGTWFMLRGKGKGNAKKSGAAVIAPSSQPAVVPSAPPVVTAAPVPVQLTPPVAASLPKVVVNAPGSKVDDESEDNSFRASRRLKKQVVTMPSQSGVTTQNVSAPADIKLSGIAWQEDRTARRAVINGLLLKEGVVVSGAKIVDIQAGKVRFSSPSGVFEIKLDAVLPGEVQK